MIVIEGEVAEWSKARAWKVRKLQKGFAGSNPAFSARLFILHLTKTRNAFALRVFCFY